MSENILEIRNLNKDFKEGAKIFEVIKNITLSVKKGEFTCILGPSGAGKSILLETIAGFHEPTSGEIIFKGKRVLSPSRERVMMFQQNVLYPWLTVGQNISFALKGQGIGSSDTSTKVINSLQEVGLSDFKDWYVHKLSGGMRQRVSLARSLIVEPDILLMDEPFASLDAQYRKYLQNQLEKIWTKINNTIIFVTHSVNEALLLGDSIYLFSARPASIIKHIDNFKLARPRDVTSESFVQKRKEIEKIMSEEFKKTKDEVLFTN